MRRLLLTKAANGGQLSWLRHVGFLFIALLIGTLANEAKAKIIGQRDICLIEKARCTVMGTLDSFINKAFINSKYFVTGDKFIADHKTLLLRNVLAAGIKISSVAGKSRSWINHKICHLEQFQFHTILLEANYVICCDAVVPFVYGEYFRDSFDICWGSLPACIDVGYCSFYWVVGLQRTDDASRRLARSLMKISAASLSRPPT